MKISVVCCFLIQYCLFMSSSTTTSKRKRDRFRDFLKWDAECDFLTSSERAIRVSQDRCPNVTSSTVPPVNVEEEEKSKDFWRKRKSQKGLKRTQYFAHNVKRKLVSSVTMGQQPIDEINITPDHQTYNLIAGTMLLMTCDGANKHENDTHHSTVDWYVNTNLVESGVLDWRVTVGEDGELSIWPLDLDDSGYFECFVDDVHTASAVVVVYSKKNAVLAGLGNYFLVSLMYLPVAIFSVFVISSRSLEVPESQKRADRMAEFLEEHVKKNGEEAKENIAKLVYGGELPKRKMEIQKSADPETKRQNKDTVKSLICRPKQVPTRIVTSSASPSVPNKQNKQRK